MPMVTRMIRLRDKRSFQGKSKAGECSGNHTPK
jgi:hypothetical protein